MVWLSARDLASAMVLSVALCLWLLQTGKIDTVRVHAINKH